jgi:hypothetical protein
VLIARLRQEIDLQPQDGEGFPSPAEADPFAWSENEDLVHALPRLLDGTPALNYVALVEHGVRIFSEAEFGQAMQIPMVANDPDLDPAQVQAHRYDTFCGLLPGLVRTLSRLVSPVIGQGAERIVLNVERGAAFIYTLPGDRYLLAVTLDQSQVGVVDDRIGQFVLAAAERLSLS